ncbi:MAG: hypothetical protein JWQ90_4191 [Hydrocarboniphaga sp.]|nr:hypothetical protein [Hydrocarboniphaga sp.]
MLSLRVPTHFGFWPARPGVTFLCSCKEKSPKESTPWKVAGWRRCPCKKTCSGSDEFGIHASFRPLLAIHGQTTHCARLFTRRLSREPGTSKSKARSPSPGAARHPLPLAGEGKCCCAMRSEPVASDFDLPGSLEKRRLWERAQGTSGHGWPLEDEMRQDVEFVRPRARSHNRAPAKPALLQGVLSFAYFSLHKQRKVRPAGEAENSHSTTGPKRAASKSEASIAQRTVHVGKGLPTYEHQPIHKS